MSSEAVKLVLLQVIMDKISVSIAVFNGEKYIYEQLLSIIAQLKNSDEVVIVDDCSTDSTIKIIQSLNDSRINLIKNDSNQGVIKSVELALLNTSGDIVFFSDQDDIWLPNKVQTCVQCLIKDQSIAVVSNARVIDDNYNVLHESYFNVRNSGSGLIKNFYKNSYIGCCMTIRASIKPYILPFPENIPMHDIWIGMVCEVLGKISFSPEVVMNYRRHADNQTPLQGSNLLYIIRKRYTLVKLLFTRILLIYFTTLFRGTNLL